MSQSPENFDAVRRLMHLKGKETPPPGFHDQLRSKIMLQIRHQPAAPKSSWWESLLSAFHSRPAIASSYALATVALVICGAGFLRMLETETAEIPLGDHAIAAFPINPSSSSDSTRSSAIQSSSLTPALVASPANATNGPLRNGPPPGLFDGAYLNTQPAADRSR